MSKLQADNQGVKRRELLVTLAFAAVIVLMGGCAFSNSFSGVFLFDDKSNILENITIRSWNQSIAPSPEQVPIGLRRRPVGRWSLTLNYAWGGLEPWGYHLLNLLVHLAAGLVLFDLVRRTLLLPDTPEHFKQHSSWLAFAAAILWVVHPLQTESVTYVIQRLESMMGLFFLVCLYCVVRGSQSLRPWFWYAAAVACCWLGMGSKEVMIVAPVVVVLLDVLFLTRSWRESLLRRWGMYLGFLSAIIWIIYAVRRTEFSQVEERLRTGEHADRWEYLCTQPGVLLHYLRLTFWPDGLCLDYKWPIARSVVQVALPGAVIVTLLVASAIGLRYRPRIGFLGLAFFLILAPTSSIMPLGHLAFEHRMYLPLAAVIILFVLFAYVTVLRFVTSPSIAARVVVSVSIGLAFVLSWCTYERNKVYQSAVAMWSDVILKSPENGSAYTRLANAYFVQHEFERVVTLCREALRINEHDPFAHTTLGAALNQLGHAEEAFAHWERALQIDPTFFVAYYNMAKTFRDQGNVTEAIGAFRSAVELNPRYEEALNDFGALLAELRRADEAVACLQTVLRLDPNNAKAHYNLGTLLHFQLGQVEQAMNHYQAVIRQESDHAKAHRNLAIALATLGDPAAAVGHLETAITLDPSDDASRKLLEQLQGAQPMKPLTQNNERR